MATNAIAIARDLTEAGMNKEIADAVAEAVTTHSDEFYATKADIIELKAEFKADIAELKGEIKALATQIKLLTGLVAGLYIGIALIFLDRVA